MQLKTREKNNTLHVLLNLGCQIQALIWCGFFRYGLIIMNGSLRLSVNHQYLSLPKVQQVCENHIEMGHNFNTLHLHSIALLYESVGTMLFQVLFNTSETSSAKSSIPQEEICLLIRVCWLPVDLQAGFALNNFLKKPFSYCESVLYNSSC